MTSYQSPWTNLISHIQDVLKIYTHTMMFYSQEHSVQDDTESNYKVEYRIIDHLEQTFLDTIFFNNQIKIVSTNVKIVF